MSAGLPAQVTEMPNQDELLKQAMRLIAEAARTASAEVSSIVVTDMLAKYVDFHRLRWRRKTLQAAESKQQTLTERIGDRQVMELRVRDARAYVADRIREYKRSGDRTDKVSAQTAEQEILFLRSAIDWGIEEELVELNPIAAWRPRAKVRYRKETLTPEQFERYYGAVQHDAARAVLRCCWDVGCRHSEIQENEWRNVRDGWLLIPEHLSKTKESRRVPITPEMQEALDRLPREGMRFIVQSPVTGRPFSKTTIYKFLSEAAKRCGLTREMPPGWAPVHVLRHSFVTDAVSHDIAATKRTVGHANMATTSRYAHPRERQVIALVEAVRGERKPARPCAPPACSDLSSERPSKK